jgi:hypothetical protein
MIAELDQATRQWKNKEQRNESASFVKLKTQSNSCIISDKCGMLLP